MKPNICSSQAFAKHNLKFQIQRILYYIPISHETLTQILPCTKQRDAHVRIKSKQKFNCTLWIHITIYIKKKKETFDKIQCLSFGSDPNSILRTNFDRMFPIQIHNFLRSRHGHNKKTNLLIFIPWLRVFKRSKVKWVNLCQRLRNS